MHEQTKAKFLAFETTNELKDWIFHMFAMSKSIDSVLHTFFHILLGNLGVKKWILTHECAFQGVLRCASTKVQDYPRNVLCQ